MKFKRYKDQLEPAWHSAHWRLFMLCLHGITTGSTLLSLLNNFLFLGNFVFLIVWVNFNNYTDSTHGEKIILKHISC